MFNNTILGIIYLIKHKTDNTKKVYVGSTINLKQRIKKHRRTIVIMKNAKIIILNYTNIYERMEGLMMYRIYNIRMLCM
jgi:predicted GIY-YIG superfamily endonuclease